MELVKLTLIESVDLAPSKVIDVLEDKRENVAVASMSIVVPEILPRVELEMISANVVTQEIITSAAIRMTIVSNLVFANPFFIDLRCKFW